MAGRRGSFRVGVDLSGWVIDDNPTTPRDATATAARPGLVVRGIDLSRTGIGLICEERLDLGARVRVAVHDASEGYPIGRQWSGRVARVREAGDAGEFRLGVEFAWPEGRGARSASAPRAPRRPLPIGGSRVVACAEGLGAWMLPGVTLAGFAADQFSKIWALSTTDDLWYPGGFLDPWPRLLAISPIENHGALASVAGDHPLTAPLCAATALALAGLFAASRRDLRGPVGAIGTGLLAAGLLGNSSDRLTLGYVRDFLVSDLLPLWSFNLADVFLLTGAVALLTIRNETRTLVGNEKWPVTDDQ